MAFDFPNAPTVGQEFISGGATYTWTGLVWDLGGSGTVDEKVDKAGDTMTGTLTVIAPAVVTAKGIPFETCGRVELQGGSSARTGILGFFAPKAAAGDPEVRLARFGWGTATELELQFENGCTGLRLLAGGIHIGNDSAVTDKFNFAKGLCLYGYGGASQFGFTITSGTLNYIVQNAGNFHDFWCGTTRVQHISATENLITGKMKTSTIADGAGGYFIGDNWHGMTFNGANALQFLEYHSIWQFVERKSGTTGGTVRYTIDATGSTGNSVNVTSPEGLSLGDELGVARVVIAEMGDSVDLVKVVAALLLKVKALEAKVNQ